VATKTGRHFNGLLRRAPVEKRIEPLRVKNPQIWFVNSMSDFFHEEAAPEWQLEALDVMQACPQHTFIILTKRSHLIAPHLERIGWALPRNVWIGVSVENAEFKFRIDHLRQIAAALRLVSFEPLIGDVGDLDLAGIQLAIVGGESGSAKGIRPMQVEWVRSIRDQCVAQNVEFFFKQWGRAANNPLSADCPRGTKLNDYLAQVDPYGKGGAKLDGAVWQSMPEFDPLTATLMPACRGCIGSLSVRQERQSSVLLM
jgi:protein gp37